MEKKQKIEDVKFIYANGYPTTEQKHEFADRFALAYGLKRKGGTAAAVKKDKFGAESAF